MLRNQQKFKELGILDLKSEMVKPTTGGKAKQRRLPKPKTVDSLLPLRKSLRVSNRPPAVYKFADVETKPARKRAINAKDGKKSLPERTPPSREAVEVAEDLCDAMAQAGKYPCLKKIVMPSHMSNGFWMNLSSEFANKELSKVDGKIILEDIEGSQWETVYLARKTGLSGGWRGFAIDKVLFAGDSLLFELIKTNHFKVHIFRSRDHEKSEEKKKRSESEEKRIQDMKAKNYKYTISALRAKKRK